MRYFNTATQYFITIPGFMKTNWTGLKLTKWHGSASNYLPFLWSLIVFNLASGCFSHSRTPCKKAFRQMPNDWQHWIPATGLQFCKPAWKNVFFRNSSVMKSESRTSRAHELSWYDFKTKASGLPAANTTAQQTSCALTALTRTEQEVQPTSTGSSIFLTLFTLHCYRIRVGLGIP